MTIRVLLVDDQALLRKGFRMILEEEPGIEVVGEAADGDEAVALTNELRPDVVLMDVRMPGMDGIEATSRIVRNNSTAKVLILTTFDLDEYAFAGLRAGASGFLLKDVPPAGLVAAIQVVAAATLSSLHASPGDCWTHSQNSCPGVPPTWPGLRSTRFAHRTRAGGPDRRWLKGSQMPRSPSTSSSPKPRSSHMWASS